MTSARLSEGYKPEFDIDLRFGRDGERLTAAFLQGFLDGTVEVKNDGRAAETGNVYIETDCLRRDGWNPSGIRTTKATYWALVVGEAVVLGIPTDVLRNVVQRALDPKLRMGREEKDGSHPTRGVAIPLNLLLTWLRMELIARARAA